MGTSLLARGFAWQCEIRDFGYFNFPRHHGSALRPDGFAYPVSLTAWTRTSNRAIPYPPASPLRSNGVEVVQEFQPVVHRLRLSASA